MRSLLLVCFIALAALAALGQSGDVKKPSTDAEVPRIGIEEAKKAYDDSSAVFVDARAVEVYKADHIKGAVVIEGAAENRFDALPKNKKIIVYCS
ncbi:MAG: rhodanese-like domain-containing protein [Acidobacteria bacterium]|nr:rhodanese-like domain-containing protein [Acidobacteriota bacterium]